MRFRFKLLTAVLAFAFAMTLASFAGHQGGQAAAGTPAYQLVKDGDTRTPPPEVKASKPHKVGIVVPHLANPHFVSMAWGFFSQAEKLGAKPILFEAGGYKYLDRQLQQVEDLVAMPVDALILIAIDLNGSVPMVQSAMKKGIPVINVNVMTAAKEVVTRIRSDDEEIGRMHGEYMAKKLNGKGNVLILAGPAGTTWATGRSKGFEDFMKAKFPSIKIIEKKWLDSDPAAGMKDMEDALQAYPNIDAVMTGSDMLGLGVGQAIFAANKAGKIVVTTTDSQPDCIKAIQADKITSTVVQSSAYMGIWGMTAAVATLEGKASQMTSRYWTPLTILDKTNADTFKFEGVSRPPEGWKVPRQ
jgi:ribose transport system substrate-binding protein